MAVPMRKDTLESIIIMVVAFAIIGGGYLYIQYESNTDPTFTNVESWSMQHSDESEIGIIDTGDMIILKNKDSAGLVTYVEGYYTGYTSFGEYGNVVVYERNPSSNQNPVIHRLILYLEYNEETGHWSAPSLEHFTGLWSCTMSTDYNDLYGSLTLYNIGYGNKTVTLNFSSLAGYEYSGYLTMGDNYSTNNYFDQSVGITKGLVTYDQINSVAWIEIPWGGILKLVKNGNINNINNWVPNSIPSMAITFIGIILCFVAINSIVNYHTYSEYYRTRDKKGKGDK